MKADKDIRIIILGAPAVGKTTLAHYIAERLQSVTITGQVVVQPLEESEHAIHDKMSRISDILKGKNIHISEINTRLASHKDASDSLAYTVKVKLDSYGHDQVVHSTDRTPAGKIRHFAERYGDHIAPARMLTAYTNEAVIELYQKATDLHAQHISNGGLLDYPEIEYGWLGEAIDEVAVGYFNDLTADGDYADSLRDSDFEISVGIAGQTLETRINIINAH